MFATRAWSPLHPGIVKAFLPGEQINNPFPGDFVFTHGTSWTSRMIRFGEKVRYWGPDEKFTRWNHVAIFINKDGDHHEEAAHYSGQTSHGSGGGRAAPFLIHFVCGVHSEFEEWRAGVDKFGYAFARSQAVLFVLRLDGLGASAVADLFFLIFDGGE